MDKSSQSQLCHGDKRLMVVTPDFTLLTTDTDDDRPLTTMETRDSLEEKFRKIWPTLSEKERRLFAADEARKWGYGGISLVSEICGLSRTTISKGLKELREPQPENGRIRRPGAGRPNLTSSDKELPGRLESVLEKGRAQEGADRVPLSWTLKSTRRLADELSEAGHPLSYVKVGQLLKELGFSLKSNRRLGRLKSRPDAAAQYALISSEVSAALASGAPVLCAVSRTVRPGDADYGAGGEKAEAESLAALFQRLVAEWRSGAEGASFQVGGALLLIVDDTASQAFRGADAAGDITAGLKGEPGVRVLRFPAGTHRWNLDFTELFSLTDASAPGGPEEETRVFLLERGAQPREGGPPPRYTLAAPAPDL